MARTILFALSALGLVAGFVIHLLAICGVEIPFSPLIFALHAGIFVVWIPMLLGMRARRRAGLAETLGAPAWVYPLLLAALIYACANFMFAMGRAPPFQHRRGPFGLKTHERVREPTPEEQHREKVMSTRALSGHWLLFYLFPTLAFFPWSGLRERQGDRP